MNLPTNSLFRSPFGALLALLLAAFSLPTLSAQEAPVPPERAAPETARAVESPQLDEKAAEPETPVPSPAPQPLAGDSQEKSEPEVDPNGSGEPLDAESEKKELETTQDESEAAPDSGTSEAVPWDDQIARVVAKKHPEGIDDLKLIERQVQKVVEHVTPATVAVQVGPAAGSGVIVSADGLVLTAGHVAGEPNRPVIIHFADGKRARGITLGMNRAIDSGMMRITDPGPWPYVDIAETIEVAPGDWVVAVGHPGGFDRERTPPVRLGRVLFMNDEVINTDATLVGGDSGGPLFDFRGRLIGIHSRIGRRITSNFHVPVAAYQNSWDRLLAAEIWGGELDADEPVRYRPLLGVAGNDADGPCRITQVFPGMPAARAGVRTGDIVRRFAGEKIDTFEELSRLVMKQKPGETVKIELTRDGEDVSIEVRLGRIAQRLPGGLDPPENEESEG